MCFLCRNRLFSPNPSHKPRFSQSSEVRILSVIPCVLLGKPFNSLYLSIYLYRSLCYSVNSFQPLTKVFLFNQRWQWGEKLSRRSQFKIKSPWRQDGIFQEQDFINGSLPFGKTRKYQIPGVSCSSITAVNLRTDHLNQTNFRVKKTVLPGHIRAHFSVFLIFIFKMFQVQTTKWWLSKKWFI